MKRSWIVGLIIVVLGLLAGAAIAGRPTSVDDTVITSPPSTAPTTTLVTTTTAPAPSSSASQSFDPSNVQVIVANGTDRAGIATSTAEVLVTAGFTEANAVDAVSALEITTVYARRGFEAAAEAVAEELGLDPTSVLALPSVPVTADDAAADVIVAIGDDFPV